MDYTVIVAEHVKVIANCELDIDVVANQRDKVTQGTLDLLEHLYLWKTQWNSEDQNSHFEISAASAGLQPVPKARGRRILPFSTVFMFSNASAATMLMLYNTTLIYVLQLLASLSPGMTSQYAVAEHSAALEICRCVPYSLLKKSSLDASSLIITHLAVKTAWTTLGSSCRRVDDGLAKCQRW